MHNFVLFIDADFSLCFIFQWDELSLPLLGGTPHAAKMVQQTLVLKTKQGRPPLNPTSWGLTWPNNPFQLHCINEQAGSCWTWRLSASQTTQAHLAESLVESIGE